MWLKGKEQKNNYETQRISDSLPACYLTIYYSDFPPQYPRFPPIVKNKNGIIEKKHMEIVKCIS